MKYINAADADRADGVAMIGVFEGDEAALFRPAKMLPVLECHLDADLDGSGAVIRVEDLCQTGRSDFDEPLCQDG